MRIILKSFFLAWLTIAFLGCVYSSETNISINQYSYNNFIKTIPFADSLNQAIDEIAQKSLPRERIVVAPLDGGMTSTKLFLLTIKEKKYVLRTLNPRHERQSKINEIRAHTYAAQIGLAPPLTYVDEKLQFMIMPYIEGRILHTKDLADPEIIKKIAESIAKLHRYEGEFDQKKPQIYRTQKHFERAQKQGFALPSMYQELYDQYYLEGLEINKNTKDLVLCHADLNAANIMIANDGTIYFIDWTSATWDNKYTDLGYFCFVNGLSDSQSFAFLKAYFGFSIKDTDIEWKMFKNAQRRTSFVTATVWFDYSESPKDQLTPKSERIKKLDILLNDPHLKTGLEYNAAHEVVSPISGSKEAIRLYALGFLKTYIDWEK